MNSLIVVHPRFDGVWPFAADHFHTLWQAQGDVEFIRLEPSDERNLGEIASNPAEIKRLACLSVPVTLECLQRFTGLEEATFQGSYGSSVSEGPIQEHIQQAGITVYNHPTEGFWGQTVSEYALALTLCGLRRIPQLHRAILSSLVPWDYEAPNGMGTPGGRGHQFGDDSNFTSGTIAGKRVRIVGAGNISSRLRQLCAHAGCRCSGLGPVRE